MPPGTSSVRINFMLMGGRRIAVPRYDSYAAGYFVCPHQLRFRNSLSNLPTSSPVAAVSQCHVTIHVPQSTSSVRINFMLMGGRRIAVPRYASYAAGYFVCQHQLRFRNSLSNLPTSSRVAAV